MKKITVKALKKQVFPDWKSTGFRTFDYFQQ